MEPGDRVGDYTLTRVVGQGSRATVWDAYRDDPTERVAVKLLDAADPTARKRLRAEYTEQSQLDHPNIVRAYELIEDEGRLALVSELVDGGDMRAYIDQHAPSRSDALKVFAGILHGLGAAHAAGLVHRDLKPTNILMTEGPLSIPKIADFGVVKRTDKESLKLTQQGVVIGTLRYMSPEQLMDASSVDARADLFSAGCILFELLTHQKCFNASHRVALVNAVRTGDHTPYPDDLDPNLRAVIDALISAEPDGRPASAQEVLARLQLPLVHTPDLAVPLHTEDEPVDRNVVIAAGLGIVALVLALGLVAYLLM
ncbi:MAG: serine/threonine-protein kinase [Myxococcota bacterium]